MIKTLNILRIRWQEVLLIVGLQAAGGFAFMQAMTTADKANANADQIVLFAALLFVTFAVVAKMLAIGFARTSFADAPVHYEPWPLLKIGYHYFWRIIGFELLVGMIMISVMIGLYVVAMLTGLETEKAGKEQLSIAMLYCAAGGMLLVAKPMLLGPAAIMVTDCTLFGTFGWLSWLRLFKAIKPLAAYILWLAIVLTPSFIEQHGGKAFVENYAVMAGFSVVAGILTLVIYVTAVKAVSQAYIQTHHGKNGLAEEPTKDTSGNQGGGK